MDWDSWREELLVSVLLAKAPGERYRTDSLGRVFGFNLQATLAILIGSGRAAAAPLSSPFEGLVGQSELISVLRRSSFRHPSCCGSSACRTWSGPTARGSAPSGSSR